MEPLRVLITGAGSGFGRATAVELAGRGHTVTAGVISDAEAQSLAGIDGVTPTLLDITDEEHLRRAGDLPIDVLVNNAALGQLGPLALIPMERVRQVFDVNVFGTLALTQLVAAGMVERGSGRILIVSSIAGVRADAMAGPYAMSKHALQSMATSLRAELAPQGVDVALLNPGPYGTGFNDRMIAGIREWLDGPEAEPYWPMVEHLSDIITVDQMDPAEAVAMFADLCEAESTQLVNPIPPGLF